MKDKSNISIQAEKKLSEGCVGNSDRGFMAMGLVSVLLVVTGIAMPGTAVAQTGTISGEVTDASNGKTIAGAKVLIQGVTNGVATDEDGRYTLRRAPAGDQILTIRYMGFTLQEVHFTVQAGERFTLNVELEPALIEGDEIFVAGQQRGQARALTRQRESQNIRTVISSEQMENMTSTTVSGALERVSGMHGGTNIRGVGSASSNVTMNGQRMGTTGKGTRAVDLGTISVDMVEEIDVIKVITPDMDADALAGVINISTRRPIGGEREFNARLGSGLNSRYFGNTGGNARASLSYGDSPSDNFSYALNAGYQRSPNGREELQTIWGSQFFRHLDGPRDILTHLNTLLSFGTTERYGTGLQLTFQPTGRTTFHVQSVFNYQQHERTDHSKVFNIFDVFNRNGYINPNRTETAISKPTGRLRYQPNLFTNDIYQNTVQASARHLFDGFDMEYKAGWGHSRYNEDIYSFFFRSTEPAWYEWYVTKEDRLAPTIDLVYGPYPKPNDYFFHLLDNEFDEHVDNEFSGAIDVEVPHNRGSFKFGSGARLTYKKGNHESHRIDTIDSLKTLSSFARIPNSEWHIFDRDYHNTTYRLSNLLDLYRARDFYYKNYPFFEPDLERWAHENATQSHVIHENILAGYGMNTVELGRFRIISGVRIEHTSNRYEGQETIFDESGNYLGSHPKHSTNNYTHLFPHVQMVYGLTSRSNARLAYSRSIARPAFIQISPYRLINHANQTIHRGNPDLNPMVSNNYDVMIEHYFMGVGVFTAGFYYKALSDFVINHQRTQPVANPEEGTQNEEIVDDFVVEEHDEFAGWRETTYINGEEAELYGVEVSWQQNLAFLPAILGNLSIFANYSWTQSTVQMDHRTAQLPGQIPHIANVGLNFQQGGLAANVFYRWSTDVLTGYGDLQTVPSIQSRERVYFDRYDIGRDDLSASLRYRLTSNMRIWANIDNILNRTTGDFFYEQEFYPRTTVMTGRSFTMGLQYSL